MNDKYIIISIAIMASITAFLRMAPFAIFSGNKKTPPIISYLGKILPYSIVAMLVVYCLKHVSFSQTSSWLPELIGIIVVAVLQHYKKNSLVSIGAGTVVYMLLVQMVFV